MFLPEYFAFYNLHINFLIIISQKVGGSEIEEAVVLVSSHNLNYLVHLTASAYWIDNSKHCLNSSSLPGTAASPLESPKRENM